MESCYDYNSKLKNGTKNKNWNWTKLNIWKFAPKLEDWNWTKLNTYLKICAKTWKLKKIRLDKFEKLDTTKNWIKLKKLKLDKIEKLDKSGNDGQNWFIPANCFHVINLGSWQWPECGKLLSRHGQHLFGQHRWRDWRGIEGSMDAVSSILQAKSPLLLQRGND